MVKRWQAHEPNPNFLKVLSAAKPQDQLVLEFKAVVRSEIDFALLAACISATWTSSAEIALLSSAPVFAFESAVAWRARYSGYGPAG